MDTFSDVCSSVKCILFCWWLIASCPSQDVQKCMLDREWLTKVDNETSTPYLLVRPAIIVVQTLAELQPDWGPSRNSTLPSLNWLVR
jgi:hypothetical protein